MLTVGLIGAGYLGKIHLDLLSRMDEIKLAGFFDSDEHISLLLNNQYSLPNYESSDQLIDDCDCLVIASPTQTHFDYANTCLQKGKHVFVEKPVTANIEDAVKLKSLLDTSDKKLQIGMVERFNPAYQAVIDKMDNVQKIFCNRLAPFTPRGADVSVVFDVMIHDLDLVRSIAQSKTKRIKAFGQKISSTTYDVATAIIEFESGLIASVTASRMAERKYRTMEIVEMDQVLKVDFLNRKAARFILNGATRGSLEEAYLGASGTLMKKEDLPVKESNAIGDELKSFIYSIVNNKKVVVSLDDGVGAMQLARDIEEQMNHQS